jgi:hypothetical protein
VCLVIWEACLETGEVDVVAGGDVFGSDCEACFVIGEVSCGNNW